MKSRKQVSAGLVGVMAVGPSHWMCELHSVTGSWSCNLSDTEEPPAAFKKKKSPSGWSKRRGNRDAQAAEKAWRNTANGKNLQRRLDARYSATEKGKAVIKLKNARKRPSAAMN